MMGPQAALVAMGPLAAPNPRPGEPAVITMGWEAVSNTGPQAALIHVSHRRYQREALSLGRVKVAHARRGTKPRGAAYRSWPA
ncbi:Hypothetical protein A7982_04472 [Minicystis rosea]|nr:Hypothetical protein A7982_04472 [Minicystis rosea]